VSSDPVDYPMPRMTAKCGLRLCLYLVDAENSSPSGGGCAKPRSSAPRSRDLRFVYVTWFMSLALDLPSSSPLTRFYIESTVRLLELLLSSSKPLSCSAASSPSSLFSSLRTPVPGTKLLPSRVASPALRTHQISFLVSRPFSWPLPTNSRYRKPSFWNVVTAS
jgi:hypothetical protein